MICCNYNRRYNSLAIFRRRVAAVGPFRTTDLLHDNPIYVSVERRDQQSRADDGSEVQEHEIVVIHYLREHAPVIARLAGVPSKER